MALQLDLDKSATTLRLSLEKAGVTTIPQMELAFDLDVSSSFEDEHRDGLTNDLLVRLVPWAMVFDPDRQMDVFTFSNAYGGRPPSHHVGTVTPETCEGYVRREIINQVPNWNGGTAYAPVLRNNLEHFGWIQGQGAGKPNGLFGGLFGGGGSAANPAPQKKRPSLILFVTDGANEDEREAERVLAEAEARGDQVYYMFLGVSNQPSQFGFIRRMGDRFSNVGFLSIKDVRRWVKLPDEEINRQVIGDELVAWMKKVA